MRPCSIIASTTDHNSGSRYIGYSDGVTKSYPYEDDIFESLFRWTYLTLHGEKKCEEFRRALAEFELTNKPK